MASSGTDIFASTSDVASLVTLFGIASGYKAETHLFFDKHGFGMRYATEDNFAMIVFSSEEFQLLNYYYNNKKEISYIGVHLKTCYTMLRSIPAKSVGQIYKIDGDDDLYVNPEGSSTKDGASKIPTINLTVDAIEPPIIRNTDRYVKVNTADFSNICSSFTKVNCKRIVFTLRKNTLDIKGFNDKNECRSAVQFRNSSPNDAEDEDSEIIDDSTSSHIKRGKINVVVRKKIPSDQYSSETTIDKLKPLTKINNLCKNGIVYVYVCNKTSDTDKRENITILKVNVGQVGAFELYLRDTKGLV